MGSSTTGPRPGNDGAYPAGGMYLEEGTLVGGRYAVVGRLGEGTMGQVYEVDHVALEKRRALKVVGLSQCSEDLRKRFLREARALSQVTSTRVARLTDFGNDPSVGLYYVMELVGGETLEDLLVRQGRLSPPETVAMGTHLCTALQDVHDAGLLHRDIKPSNIALTPKDEVAVRLLDFGLAVCLDSTLVERLTARCTVVGSAAYMAPEQIMDRPLATPMDLYALGVVLYECLAGSIPFDGVSPAQLIERCIGMPPPPFAVAAPEVDIPAPLEAIVIRLLDKDPAQRFESATAVGRALTSIL